MNSQDTRGAGAISRRAPPGLPACFAPGGGCRLCGTATGRLAVAASARSFLTRSDQVAGFGPVTWTRSPPWCSQPGLPGAVSPGARPWAGGRRNPRRIDGDPESYVRRTLYNLAADGWRHQQVRQRNAVLFEPARPIAAGPPRQPGSPPAAPPYAAADHHARRQTAPGSVSARRAAPVASVLSSREYEDLRCKVACAPRATFARTDRTGPDDSLDYLTLGDSPIVLWRQHQDCTPIADDRTPHLPGGLGAEDVPRLRFESSHRRWERNG